MRSRWPVVVPCVRPRRGRPARIPRPFAEVFARRGRFASMAAVFVLASKSNTSANRDSHRPVVDGSARRPRNACLRKRRSVKSLSASAFRGRSTVDERVSIPASPGLAPEVTCACLHKVSAAAFPRWSFVSTRMLPPAPGTARTRRVAPPGEKTVVVFPRPLAPPRIEERASWASVRAEWMAPSLFASDSGKTAAVP